MAIVRQLTRFFEQHPEALVCVYLFGSTARGTATADSDVDLAVLYADEPPATLDSPELALAADLELVEKKLAFIETCARELRQLCSRSVATLYKLMTGRHCYPFRSPAVQGRSGFSEIA